jgi:hypothetical protein
MKRLIALALLALALLPAATVSAAPRTAPPIPVSGTFELNFGELTLTPLGQGPNGPCLVTLTGSYAFHGGIEAEGPTLLKIVIHGPCDDSPPFTYRENGRISGTLSGTVAGRSGTFDYHWVFGVREHVARGVLVIKNGRDGLEGLHGVLRTRADQTPAPATYSGFVSFAQ